MKEFAANLEFEKAAALRDELIELKKQTGGFDSVLKELVRQRKGPVQTPKSVEFIAAIPLTSLGKPDKKLLRAQHGSPTQHISTNEGAPTRD